ncbi:MAG TPA: sigma-70 family RNA polymerase sigma factor [Polyangiaceae bacterium]|nr:sigma-70 family RNA polymerase sigma factor [Polyangiaceae bacterium]
MVAEALGRRVASQAAPAGGRAVSGQRPMLASVYEAHFRYVWRCLRSLGVRDAQLDDALQDVFVVAARKLEEFDGGAELRTWLYAIAINIARKYRERLQREPLPLALQPEQGGPASTAEVAVHRSEQLALARAALEALSDDQREVFVLSRVEQMSAPEVAEVVGIPLNTVYSRLRAARLAFEAEVARLKTLPRSTHEP